MQVETQDYAPPRDILRNPSPDFSTANGTRPPTRLRHRYEDDEEVVTSLQPFEEISTYSAQNKTRTVSSPKTKPSKAIHGRKLTQIVTNSQPNQTRHGFNKTRQYSAAAATYLDNPQTFGMKEKI
ncbi:hypothetical protein A2U01_0004126 [Trifolium medium]|uniref:Uncharacterized protein n=1 Tax=Trifolium medium TaxID=97028 RepID=A0A392M759_9FABA|nr:hypothetical protein [Trifolium medium]